MTEKALYQDRTEEERIELLRGEAAKTTTDRVRRYYSEDEKAQIKDFVTEESGDLMEKEEAFAEVRSQHNKHVKGKRSEIMTALKTIRKGYSEADEEIFLMADYENDMMHIYDKRGVYISSRRMLPEERQTKILELKEGTNN
jgi:hypothetical protein